MANVLRTVHLPKMADIVAGEVRSQIIFGELKDGDPLPPEDQLMMHAGVARTTVREALRILESEGLVVVRRGAGGGARIKSPSVSSLTRYVGLMLQSQGATLQDVFDARLLLEAPAAGKLAEAEAEAEDHDRIVAQLRNALADEEAVLHQPGEPSCAYGRFHHLIVTLSGSQTFEILTSVSSRMIQVHADRHMRAKASESDHRLASDAGHQAHIRFVESVAAGAAQDAEELWRKHLAAAYDGLQNGLDGNGVLDLL